MKFPSGNYLALAGVLILTAGASAAPPVLDPTGEWMVEKGYATIRIVDCAGKLWGVVASEKTPGGIDSQNPDPKLRTRPTLGMPVLVGMAPSKPNEWSGNIYNSQDGRTYEASISLTNPDLLKVQGCVLGFLCGGENWTRVPAEKPGATTPAQKPAASTTAPRPTTSAKPAQAPAQPAQTAKPPVAGQAAAPGAQAQASVSPQTASSEEICLGLVGLPGSAHERRLK